jgi:hypothetical protein
MNIIEDVVKKVKKVVRFSDNNEIFEFFLDDVVATGSSEPTREQMARYAALEHDDESSSVSIKESDDDLSYDDLKSDGGKSDADDVASVDTMAISISRADITLGEEEVELSDSEEEEDPQSPTQAPQRSYGNNVAANPFPNRNNQLAKLGSLSCPTSPAAGDPRRIVFTRKHQWKHKQHNTTVVGEKRWRLCEDFNTDEVIFSPLSKDQHNRRKAVEGSLKKSLMLLGGGPLSSSSHSSGHGKTKNNKGNLSVENEEDLEAEEETHVDVVERRLRENNIDLEGVLRRGGSSRSIVCLTPSPKRSMSSRRLTMADSDQPELPF